jgi:lambda family phage portal protein
MRRLAMLGGYEEAALVAARVGASKMGFFTSSTDEPVGPPQGERDTADGALIQDAEPGTFETLPEGYDFKEWNPQYPHGEMATFNKVMLRGAAAGLGVAYNGLAGDLEGVNFSSIRAGTIEERDAWRMVQRFVRARLHSVVVSHWLEQSLLKGAIALPFAKFDKFNRAVWHARGWDWVDPKNDIEASALEIALGLASRTKIAARKGGNFEQTLRELSSEQDLARKYGVPLLDPSNLKGAPWKQAGDVGGPPAAADGGTDNAQAK